MVWLYFFCLVNKKNLTKGNTEYSTCGVLSVSTSIIKGSGHTDNGGRATPCKTDVTKWQIRMSIFLFLETILFPLPNLCYLLITALTLTVWMGVWSGLTTSHANLSKKTHSAHQNAQCPTKCTVPSKRTVPIKRHNAHQNDTVPIKIELQHNCTAVQFIFNWNTSVAGHEHVMILCPLLSFQPRS